MGRFGRWVVAGLVTVAGFAVPTWLCGVLVLPSVLEDSGVRWSVAAGVGAAVAALAGMWGYGFAARPSGSEPLGPVVQAPGGRAVAIGGSNSGSISTSDTHAPTPGPPSDQAAGGQPTPQQSSAQPALGTVSAAGDRSIAIGGDNTGPLSTGDHHGGTQP